MNQNSNLLITGVSGFIGLHRHFLERSGLFTTSLALWLVAASAAGWFFSLSKAERGDLLLRLKTS